jgi:hypothetical protein
MTNLRAAVLAGLVTMSLASLVAQEPPAAQPPAGQGRGQGRGGQAQRMPRDRAAVPKGTATIAGRVLTADTGRPVKRARVAVTGTVAGGGRGGRTVMTDDQGRYRIAELAAGAYNVSASKTGFVDAVYGQRRPLQPGTPVQLADGQSAGTIDLRLTRGGVITGRVVDEDGEALARALVTVQRFQYVRGERELVAAGGDQTDDRGQYRVFGLPPGEYFVSASASGLSELLSRGLQQLAAGLGGGGRGGGRGGFFAGPEEPEATGYAPTYYPGVVSAPDAGKVAVGPGSEVAGIDFQIQLVPFATVRGIVAGAEDGAAVMLVPQDSGVGRGPMARLGGQVLTGRTQADGTFSISSVPPGRFVAIARGGGRGESRIGMQSLVVNGQNIDGVALTLQPGITLSGNITVESSGTPAPTDYSMFRLDAPEVDPLPIGAGGGRGAGPLGAGGRTDKNGSFQITNLLPGAHYLRVTGGGVQGGGQAQWTVKAITIGGQDVTDSAIELKPGQNVDGVTVVLTDQTTEITGTVRDAKNAGMPAISVIAFSTDEQHWRAQSRRINAVRTDQTGAFRVRNLPPGDYFLVATDDVEQGEWFDPAFLAAARDAARRISISEGDKKTQDLRGPS